MTETELRQVYAGILARNAGPRSRCPSPETIQALAQRQGDEAARLATLDHVMSCRDCQTELDLLRSLEEAADRIRAPAKPDRRPWFVPVALAASLLIAFGLGRLALQPRPDDVVRSAPGTGAVVVVAPEAEVTAGAPVLFAWHPVAGATRYRVELLTADGDIAVEAETQDTAVTLNSVAALAPGAYQWWVIAMTPGSGSRSSLRPLRLITQ